MKIKKSVFGLLLVMAVTASACGVAAARPEAMAQTGATMEEEVSTTEAMMEEKPAPEAMMEEESSTEAMMAEEPAGEAMMGEESPAEEMMGEEHGTEAMMAEEPAGEAMMGEEPTAEAMMAEEESMMGPAWYSVDLTDVNTGVTFKVADFQGKVVLVETLAVWCSTCLRQQKEVQALHELLGERDDVVSVGLDIDPNETSDVLKAHTSRNGFDWLYAVAPVDVAREIGQLYGDQFLNPPSAPMLIIDRQGQAHPLPFGVKKAETLQEALDLYLNR